MTKYSIAKAMTSASIALVLAACGSSGRGLQLSSSLGGGASASPVEGTGQAEGGAGAGSGSTTGSTAGSTSGGASGGASGAGTGGGLLGGLTGSGSTGGGAGAPAGDAAGGLLYTAGNVVLNAAGRESQVGSGVSAALPTTGPLNAGVTGVLTGTGKTLRQTGQALATNGAGGLVGAPGGVAAVNVLDTSIGGGAQAQPLLGVGALSPTQPTGQLATVGVLSGGQAATLAVPAVTGATGLLGTPAPTGVANGALSGLTGTVGGLVGTPGATANVAGAANPAGLNLTGVLGLTK